MNRHVTTLEELAALPLGSIVTRNGVPYRKVDRGHGWVIWGTTRNTYTPGSLLLNHNATLLSASEDS